MNHADCLFELGCEELPTLSLQPLITSLINNMHQHLTQANIQYQSIVPYVTPRRLAFYIKHLAAQQPDQTIERKGPSTQAPLAAREGFARSCGVSLDQLAVQGTAKGECYIFTSIQPGKATAELLPEMIEKSLQQLPLQKRMRWGDGLVEFVRPIHWAVLLYNNEVIAAEFFGCKTGRTTRGHRFHSNKPIAIDDMSNYSNLLLQHYVIVDWQTRWDSICNQITQTSAQVNALAVMNESLLNEVCGLVEWPKALLVSFNERFLQVPQEALISAMHHHQKCFHLVDERNKLLPYFITISNLESRDPPHVILGNQRVMDARLNDAEFFYKTDLQTRLAEYQQQCQQIVFQQQLGSLLEKTQRIATLAKFIAKNIQTDEQQAYQAGLFCKADLMTQMVQEFPELQGIMGYYYAKAQGHDEIFSQALRDHYLPRFSGDALPEHLCSCAVAIADRIDTIVGIFGINRAPTGEKDPFGLRRAALGVLRIIIEKCLLLNCKELLQQATQLYGNKLGNHHVADESFAFMIERLRSWYLEKGITPDVFAAVFANQPEQPYDFHQRLLAVQEFRKLPEANALAAANKRVSKILIKENQLQLNQSLDAKLFANDSEHQLANQLKNLQQQLQPLFAQNNYQAILTKLATLREPVDAFFDNVLVMDEDIKIRNNRLALLNQLRQLFLQVADISLLQ